MGNDLHDHLTEWRNTLDNADWDEHPSHTDDPDKWASLSQALDSARANLFEANDEESDAGLEAQAHIDTAQEAIVDFESAYGSEYDTYTQQFTSDTVKEVTYRINGHDGSYAGAELRISIGGPDIILTVPSGKLEGWWGSDHGEQWVNPEVASRLDDCYHELAVSSGIAASASAGMCASAAYSGPGAHVGAYQPTSARPANPLSPTWREQPGMEM